MCFLQQKCWIFRHTPAWLDRMLNNVTLLRSAAAKSHMTSARTHGELALAMLRLEHSNLRKELDKLVDYLEENKPDLLVLSTALQVGGDWGVEGALGGEGAVLFSGGGYFYRWIAGAIL